MTEVNELLPVFVFIAGFIIFSFVFNLGLLLYDSWFLIDFPNPAEAVRLFIEKIKAGMISADLHECHTISREGVKAVFEKEIKGKVLRFYSNYKDSKGFCNLACFSKNGRMRKECIFYGSKTDVKNCFIDHISKILSGSILVDIFHVRSNDRKDFGSRVDALEKKVFKEVMPLVEKAFYEIKNRNGSGSNNGSDETHNNG